jgi:TonB family protein
MKKVIACFFIIFIFNVVFAQEKEFDTPPELIGGQDTLRILTQQEYPSFAKKVGLEGDIIVEVEVDANGKVVGFEWIFGRQSFEKAVDKILKKVKYKPAIKNGAPVNAKIRQEIVFKLPPPQKEF